MGVDGVPRIAKYGVREIRYEPSAAGLTRQPAEAVRASVSIGKKTVGRALCGPV
jgi:hypothetical protein